jgi:hypothetical protein
LYVLSAAGATAVFLASHRCRSAPRQLATASILDPSAHADAARALDRVAVLARLARLRASASRTGSDEERPQLAKLSDLDRSPDEDYVLRTVQEQLVADCMRRRGFTYLRNAFGDDTGAAPPRAGGPGDIDAARTEGYGIVRAIRDHATAKPRSERNTAALASMTVEQRGAFLEALQGPAILASDPSVRSMVDSVPLPGGGRAYWYRDSCLAEARRALYGTDYEHNELGYAQAFLERDVHGKVASDPEYQASLDAWRTCMRDRGFDDELPGAAENRLASAYHQGKLSLDELRAQEVSTATADAECYAQSGVASARRAAEARAEAQIIEDSGEQIAAMKRARDEALQRAEGLLTDGGG